MKNTLTLGINLRLKVTRVLCILINGVIGYSFKRQSHKMAKHTQTVCRQIADELFEGV